MYTNRHIRGCLACLCFFVMAGVACDPKQGEAQKPEVEKRQKAELVRQAREERMAKLEERKQEQAQQQQEVQGMACARPSGPEAATIGAKPKTERISQAMFGAGCFWGVEATFRRVEGVLDTAVGYAGGSVENPTYKQVCTGRTGHAEVVHVTYDPTLISYEALLETFWNCHDPTTLNRQGPDVGTQYRSVIFCYDDLQRELAEASGHKTNESGRFKRPIVTDIQPAPAFYRAEDYHQQYYEKQGGRQHATSHW